MVGERIGIVNKFRPGGRRRDFFTNNALVFRKLRKKFGSWDKLAKWRHVGSAITRPSFPSELLRPRDKNALRKDWVT